MSQRNVDDDEEYERVWRKQRRLMKKIERLNAEAQAANAIIEAAVRAKRTLKECSRITAGGSDEELEALIEAVEAYEKEKG